MRAIPLRTGPTREGGWKSVSTASSRHNTASSRMARQVSGFISGLSGAGSSPAVPPLRAGEAQGRREHPRRAQFAHFRVSEAFRAARANLWASAMGTNWITVRTKAVRIASLELPDAGRLTLIGSWSEAARLRILRQPQRRAGDPVLAESCISAVGQAAACQGPRKIRIKLLRRSCASAQEPEWRIYGARGDL